VVGPPTTTEGPDDDRSSSGDSLVAFLFGVAGVPELPGVALTPLLVDLGMSVAAARRQIARMCAQGRLASSRSGRGAGPVDRPAVAHPAADHEGESPSTC
jgi:hypothetical protein